MGLLLQDVGEQRHSIPAYWSRSSPAAHTGKRCVPASSFAQVVESARPQVDAPKRSMTSGHSSADADYAKMHLSHGPPVQKQPASTHAAPAASSYGHGGNAGMRAPTFAQVTPDIDEESRYDNSQVREYSFRWQC